MLWFCANREFRKTKQKARLQQILFIGEKGQGLAVKCEKLPEGCLRDVTGSKYFFVPGISAGIL